MATLLTSLAVALVLLVVTLAGARWWERRPRRPLAPLSGRLVEIRALTGERVVLHECWRWKGSPRVYEVTAILPPVAVLRQIQGTGPLLHLEPAEIHQKLRRVTLGAATAET